MKERFIDSSSDHWYSLYRCLSKEIFGTERHYSMLVEYVVKEVRSNARYYGRVNDFRGASKIRDLFEFKSTAEKKNAEFYADRIEDGLNLEDLELLAVSTFFQCPVSVLFVDSDGTSTWREFTPMRPMRKPDDFEKKIHKSTCEPLKYYLTLVRTSYGQFHRIVPRHVICNCLIDNPANLKIQIETLYSRQDSSGKIISQ